MEHLKMTIERTDGIKKAYQGYFTNKQKLNESASGGLATALSEKIIKEGGIVYGVAYAKDFKSANYQVATNIKELQGFKSSKYIKAHLEYNGSSIFIDVKKQLERGKKVLFIGLPCTIVGLCNFLKKKYENLYLVDLICHGPTEDVVAEQFISNLEKKYKSKIIKFNVRYKKLGWTPPFIQAIFENKKIYEKEFYESDYGYAFNIYEKLSCANCVAKGNNHKSDLTIGDYWGLKEQHQGYNKNGVSIAFTRSLKGENMLHNLDSFNIQITNIDFALLHNSNVNNQTIIDLKKRKKFDKLIKKKGLHYAVTHTLSIKQRVKRIIPHLVIRILKKIMKR